MKVVIFAGGFGTRISEESGIKPKPMVEIGGMPILWHIMKIYAAHGLTEFIICTGYKSYVIKEYFSNYFLHTSDITFDMKNNKMIVHKSEAEPWKVTLVDTGKNTMTGGRLKRVREYLGDETFCLTYGDGVSNVNVGDLINFHKQHGKLATITAVSQPGRFGVFNLKPDDDTLSSFKEKPAHGGNENAWVNGGFFVCELKVIDFISGDSTVWEREPMEKLAYDKQMVAYRHTGFWQPMDTLRDKMVLEELWESKTPPWKVW